LFTSQFSLKNSFLSSLLIKERFEELLLFCELVEGCKLFIGDKSFE